MSDELNRMLENFRQALRSELRRDEADLSLRQLGIFLIVYQAAELQTVRGLAETLNIGKAVVSRSLDKLSWFGMTQRIADPSDGRSVLVRRTEAGTAMMLRLSQAMATAANAIWPQAQAAKQ